MFYRFLYINILPVTGLTSSSTLHKPVGMQCGTIIIYDTPACLYTWWYDNPQNTCLNIWRFHNHPRNRVSVHSGIISIHKTPACLYTWCYVFSKYYTGYNESLILYTCHILSSRCFQLNSPIQSNRFYALYAHT